MSARVQIYTTNYCGYCVRAKQLLKQKGVPFEEISADDPSTRRWLVEASGQRTVPQIFIDGRSLGGYTELAAAESSGELDRRLAASPEPSPSPADR